MSDRIVGEPLEDKRRPLSEGDFNKQLDTFPNDAFETNKNTEAQRELTLKSTWDFVVAGDFNVQGDLDVDGTGQFDGNLTCDGNVGCVDLNASGDVTAVDDLIGQNIVAAPYVFHVEDQKSSGTSGGGATASSWNTRVLNTVATNTISGASLSSNQLELPAGTYKVQIIGTFYSTAYSKVRFRNTTDSTTDVIGNSQWARSAYGYVTSTGMDIITIADTKVFELQYYVGTAKTTNGLGLPTSSGEVEIYSGVYIEKLA